MITRMWNAKKLGLWVIAFGVVAIVATPALAQTSGTVAISGTVTAAVKITSGGAASLAGNVGGGVTVSSGSDAALATVVDFGDVGPGNGSTYVCFTQPLFLRANAPSTVSAAVTAESFGGGAGDLAKDDIGIGFQNLLAGGVNADVSTTTVTAAYNADPCSAPVDADGIPTFSATLNNLATVVPGTAVITSTGAISLRAALTPGATKPTSIYCSPSCPRRSRQVRFLPPSR